MKCPKCCGDMGKPVYKSRYNGLFKAKLEEWLRYECTTCGYIGITDCKDNQ